jgi:predicted nucleotidyltransferase
MNEKLAIDKAGIADFCQRHHIARLAIFGSALRDDFRPESDVDVLVDFEPGHVPGFFRLFDMEEELSALFEGRKVDLRTPEDLSRYFRDRVVAQAEVQYAHEDHGNAKPPDPRIFRREPRYRLADGHGGSA